MSWFGLAGYSAAAVAYAAMTAVLLADRGRGGRLTTFVWAAAFSSVWAVANAVLLFQAEPLSLLVASDALHLLFWTFAISSWLSVYSQKRSLRALLSTVSIVLTAWSILSVYFASRASTGESGIAFFDQGVVLAPLAMGLVGLLAVEQVFSNASTERREGLRLLCFGVGVIFVLDVFIYSQVALVGGLVSQFWVGRGFASAALAPLIVIALKVPSDVEREFALSRKLAFYTASLVAVGAYLVAMAATAFVIRGGGGEWGLLLQIIFVVSALAGLAYFLFSSSIRAHAKVLLLKHFFKTKYDYRQEWLRLTEWLGRSGELRTLSRNALEGIAGIVGSDGADLWLTRDGKHYEWLLALRPQGKPEASYSIEDPMVSFLASTGWVIDTEEYDKQPERYGHTIGMPGNTSLPEASLVVPLDRRGYLQGFVVLHKPPAVKSLNFEDHDILKTAGRQVALVLAQALAQEQLSETRQFEAVNKLATFLMHDLKNLIAQQELVVANSKRFMSRPGFVEDAIRSIDSGAKRMRNILSRLQDASLNDHPARVDVGKLLTEVCNQCSDRAPCPSLVASTGIATLEIDRDRIAMAITHAIRNAQDATRADGHIAVELQRTQSSIVIEVRDNGAGMSGAFIRDRLFKPFDSTKGAQGMGVGAYQIRETMRAAGGEVEVESEPGRGTIVRMQLPLPAEQAQAQSVA